MKNIFSRTLSLVLLFFVAANAWADNQYGLKDKIQDGVILHCFDWTLKDIKAAIPDIAAAGFTAVQTSPVHKQESKGASWYMLYQPYDYAIGNGIGSEADLKDLCAEAHNYGVKVIVDVVANHTNGDLNYVADRLKSTSLYHTPFTVTNWNDRYQVINGKIGMWDLDTNNSTVQGIIKSYIQSLKSCGVDGIRWDAIKHIGVPSEGDSFMTNVVDQTMYNYGELLDNTGGNDRTLFPEYQKYMSITDNTYSNGFASSFNSGQINESVGAFNQRGASTDKLVYWGESHDTYSNDGGSSKNISQNNIDRAYAIVAGNNGATALYFSRPSATNNSDIRVGAKGSTHFTSKEVAEVNHMHNVCAGEPNYYVHANGVGAQVRNSGAVIVLGSGGNRSISVANGAGNGKWLAAGTYTDHVAGGTFTVTASTISGQVGSTGIAVLYNAAPVVLSPVVTFNPATGTAFSEETLTVTATPANFTSAWVQVNGGAKQNITAATTLTVGADVDYGKSVTIAWSSTGKDADGADVTKTGEVVYNKVQAYVPVLDGSDEVSCFLETSNDAANIYVWNASTPYAGTWPGSAMTLVGQAASGKNVFKWTYSGTETNLPEGVIFLDGQGTGEGNKLNGGDQPFKNHGYYVEGEWSKEVTKVRDDEPTEKQYVYYKDPNNWSEVYCYFYDGTTAYAAWPGVKMTYDETVVHDGQTGWYKVVVPSAFANGKFYINDGTAAKAVGSGN